MGAKFPSIERLCFSHWNNLVNTQSILTRWRTIFLLMGFAALGHFNRIGISVAGAEVFIPKLGLSETQMGWVYSAFLIVYTIGMLPGGWLIDRYGSKFALALFGVSMGAFVILTGMLGWVTARPEGLWLGLLVIRGCAGLCNVPLHPGAAHIVAESISARGQATANGMVTAGALIGIAFCYPTFGWLIDHFGWQLAFVAGGLALVGYGVIWRLLMSPSDLQDNSQAASNQIDPIVDTRRLQLGNLWLLSISYAAYGYFQYLFFYWMDYYFKTVLHVPTVDARWASFWITLAQGAGMVLGGICTDVACRRLGTTRGRRIVVLTGMGMGALFGLLAVNATLQINVAMCLAISMGALGMCEGVFWTTATDIGGKSRGFAAAFMNTGGNVGGLISPVLTPVLAQRMGWQAAIMVACAICAFGGGVWFAIQIPQRQPDAA